MTHLDPLSEIFSAFKEGDGLDEAPVAKFRTDGNIESAADAKRFILGGKATFTLVSTKTKARFTYKVTTSENGHMYFVSVLNGPDNWHNYKYIGHMFTESLRFMVGRKSKIAADAPSVKAFTWAWSNLLKGHKPATLEIWHSMKCGRCGLKLTVPSSIASGFGPECVKKIG